MSVNVVSEFKKKKNVDVNFVQNRDAGENVRQYSHSRNTPHITSFMAHSILNAIHSNNDLMSSITFMSEIVVLATV
jgi:ABC-type thiamine transport system substrate-binding protein